MTLPDQMIDRWARRADPAPGQRTLYWHVLMRDHPEVSELARQARERLAPFGGMHFTPQEWLHMTTLVAGPAAQFSHQQMQHMVKIASDRLAAVSPITVSVGKILYHPEAIMLAVTPADALAPIRCAAVAATNAVTGHTCEPAEAWTPHVTIAYSTAVQPAQPRQKTSGYGDYRFPATKSAEFQRSWTPRLTEMASELPGTDLDRRIYYERVHALLAVAGVARSAKPAAFNLDEPPSAAEREFGFTIGQAFHQGCSFADVSFAARLPPELVVAIGKRTIRRTGWLKRL